MNNKVNHFLAAILGASLFGSGMSASAGKPDNVTNAEMVLLPRYCPDTMGFNYGDATWNTSPNAAKWVAMMGHGFWAVHHHCWALIKFHRAERATMDSGQKLAYRESALGDFWYVVKNTNSDFVLLPEIFTWIGRTEILLGHPSNAGEAFARARASKADYWPAYSYWAEFLVTAGHRADAMAIVKAGLQQAPNAKPLLDLFGRLGGKPADIPPPIVKKESAATQESPTAETGQQPALEAQNQNQRP
jgi:hypothetical protein